MSIRHYSPLKLLCQLLFFILGFSQGVSQESLTPVYDITDIPPQRIWYDEGNTTLTFTVTALSLGPNPSVSMSITEAGTPDGPLAFNDDSDTFSYTPALTDTEPFAVVFIAIGTGTPIVQEVTIEPVHPLLAEVESFGLEPGNSLPDDEVNDKYFSYATSLATPAGQPTHSATNWFNHASLPETQAVTISGRTIVLEKGHPNGLFEKLHYDATESPVQNIERLEIHADRLIIRDSIHLPQTDVTIHALELIFEDRGSTRTTLTTTPLVPNAGSRPPSAGENGFKSTADQGSPGGDLLLYVRTVEASGTAPRFILTGGTGHAASLGKNGLGPTNSTTPIRAYSTSYYTIKNLLAAKITTPIAVYAQSKANYDARLAWGSTLPSQFHGRPALAAGRPGKSGDGGNFLSNLDLSTLVTSPAGSAGSKGANTTGGKGTKITGTDGKLYDSGVIYSGSHNILTGVTTTNAGFPKIVSAVNGANATAPSAGGAGLAGRITLTTDEPPLWLSSSALRYSLAVLRDAYLDGHHDFVAGQLSRYLGAIEDAAASDQWANSEPAEIEAIEELRDEMITIQSRLDNNLDYFGNPAGWVPMLSFEVNYAAFEQEIDRALRVWYLNYWLGNIATGIADRVAGLEAMREQLLAQIEQDRTDYGRAVEDIPGVRIQAEELQDKIDFTLRRIQAVEAEVLKKAKRIAATKKAARTLGKIAQTIPIYQPALGAAGGAIAAAADIDPNKSWEENALNVGTGAAGGFSNGNALAKGNSAKSAMDGINTTDGDLADDPAVRAALKEARGPLLELSKEIGGIMLKDKAADPEVEAELQRLLADHPAFRALQSSLDQLNTAKRDFAGQLSDLLQKITVLPIQVARNLSIISKLNTELASEADKLDPITLSFLDDLGARSQERLLKYHYYLSRAYVYRRLESYPGTLDLASIREKLVELAIAGGAEIGVDQLSQLKAVYEDQLGALAAAILNEANENPSEQSISVLFPMPQRVIDQINNGEVARLNLGELDLFPDSEENLRITGLEVTAMDLLPDPGLPSPNAYNLIFKHSGISRLQKDGKTYSFRHYNESTRSAITWKSSYQFLSGMIVKTEPSAASRSLIGTLVNKDPNDILIYTRPAINADLLVSSEINTTGAKVELRSAAIRVYYDFKAKSEFIKSVKVTPGPNGLMPEIEVGQADLSQRTNGREAFERFYDRNTAVTIKAPTATEGLSFVRWEGVGLTNPTEPTQTLSLSQSYLLTPIYQAAESFPLTVQGGTGSGTYELGDEVEITATPPTGYTFVNWTGDTVEDPTLATTTIPIYGQTLVTAVLQATAEARIRITPAGTPGQVLLTIESDDSPNWILQTSSSLNDNWINLQNFTLINGQIEIPIDLGTDPAYFQVIPAE